MLSCRVRVAEKLGFKIWFHLSKKKTEKLVLTRNILNQLNKQKKCLLRGVECFSVAVAIQALHGFVRAKFTLWSCRWYYKPKRYQLLYIFV